MLPVGWKKSLSVFCSATETIADIANTNIATNNVTHQHPLSTLASIYDEPVTAPNAPIPLPAPTAHMQRDPCLPYTNSPTAYIDVFVDDFIALAQTRHSRNYVRNTLMNAIDEVFRPLSPLDHFGRQELISIKKLMKKDCSWETQKVLLGWVVNTISQTIHLPDHRIQNLKDIPYSIPSSQKRISVDKWHSIVGELRSMALALPGARNLFSHMQYALKTKKRPESSTKKRYTRYHKRL